MCCPLNLNTCTVSSTEDARLRCFPQGGIKNRCSLTIHKPQSTCPRPFVSLQFNPNSFKTHLAGPVSDKGLCFWCLVGLEVMVPHPTEAYVSVKSNIYLTILKLKTASVEVARQLCPKKRRLSFHKEHTYLFKGKAKDRQNDKTWELHTRTCSAGISVQSRRI